MDIKIPDSTLRKFLKTDATPEKIAEAITLCGPSVDRLHKIDGDYVYDIEVITNRVDTASAFGIAREANAILPLFGIKSELMNSPYDIISSDLPERNDNTKLPLTIEVTDSDLVSKLTAIVLDNLIVKESSSDIVKQLTISGIRPQNNLVDVTNYLTLCYGQPVHIFDYDKIKGHKLIIRNSKSGEIVTTLDNKKHTLRGEDIVIEDGSGNLIDLCGIMGGKLSEVDDKTTRAVLFVQTYNPKKIRKTSLYTQERTLAAQIFEKNPDSKLVTPVLIQGVKLLQEFAKARIAGDSIDTKSTPTNPTSIALDLKWLNKLIGIKFELKTVSSILKNLGFSITNKTSSILNIAVPSWRHQDISIPEDLAEEIARIYGYFRLEGKLPVVANPSTYSDPILDLEYLTKSYLNGLGFTEIFNYSLVSEDIFTKANLSIDHSIKLKNPLTKEFEYMRRSLIPSILMDLENNQGKIDPPIKIFELSNIYLNHDHKEGNLPEETPILVTATQGEGYRHAKGYLEALFNKLNISNIHFIPYSDNSGPWKTNQTAEIYSDNHFIGVFGSISTGVKKSFSIDGEVYIANLDFKAIANLSSSTRKIIEISEFPDIIEDVTIESALPIEELTILIKQESPLITKVIYKESLNSKHTFTIHFNDPKRNLSQVEIEKVKENILKIK